MPWTPKWFRPLMCTTVFPSRWHTHSQQSLCNHVEMLCKHAGVRRSGDNSCNRFPSLCPRESNLGSQAWQQVPDLLSPAVRPPCSAAVTAVLSLQSWTAQNLRGFFCFWEPPSSARLSQKSLRKADGLCSLPRMSQQVKPSWSPLLSAGWMCCLHVRSPSLVSGWSGT